MRFVIIMDHTFIHPSIRLAVANTILFYTVQGFFDALAAN